MRLTDKYECGYEIRTEPHNCGCGELQVPICEDQDVRNKLGQLEDIEEELGIDFSMLDKICQNGVYCYKKSIKDFNTLGKRLGNIIHIQNSDIHIEFFGACHEPRMGISIMGCIDYVYHTLPIKDYGVTWSLNKEDLV